MFCKGKDTENKMCINLNAYVQSNIKNKPQDVKFDSNLLLTGNGKADASLLWTRRVHVKDAGVAAFITEAHPADGYGGGVFWGRGELHVLLSTHAVFLARLVTQQGLVLGIQPMHPPQGLTSVPWKTAG